eukprot:TRINITY_DN12432_c0_g2_i1.p1 TRINITY_DN12432_c0_g2~~TRINITY_DN12432_c0_g2_i1.p1  ORF type:complete len:133 (+),score=19.93 TRINITY_DN12432_c0_g2_i1:45-443(+)
MFLRSGSSLSFRNFALSSRTVFSFFASAPCRNFVAASIADAVRQAALIEELHLSASNDLICHNIICEEVGNPCLCRLAALLSRLPNLRVLDLSGNRTLNVEDNLLTELPPELRELPLLQRLDFVKTTLKTRD